MSTTLEIVEVDLPQSMSTADVWMATGLAELIGAASREIWNNDDQVSSAEEILTWYHDQDYAKKAWILALDDREVLGGVRIEMTTRGNSQLAETYLVVHPDRRRQGIGTRLAESAEAYVRANGRSVIISVTEHRNAPTSQDFSTITAPTGTGKISATDPDVSFAFDRGYRFEQVESHSVLELPVGPILLATLIDDAAAHAGPEYRLLGWANETPEEWVQELAELETRMSTDMPSGNLKFTSDPWDAERVRAAEQLIAERGRGYAISAIEHIPSSTLAGFSMLEWPKDNDEVVFQQDTIVLNEHRGRRIGQWVKAANLVLLNELRPQAQRVHTWNAQENEHMISINSRLGFEPAGVIALWQKHLED